MGPVVEQFSDWLYATDEHAQSRLRLLERAERILNGSEDAGREQCERLAAALERWRYQHLNRCSGRASLEDAMLSNALDLAANELSARTVRAPRATRAVVAGEPYDEAVAAEQWTRPVEELAIQARSLTRERFSVVVDGDGEPALRRRVLMYAPLYLSSHCVNHCLYCGFRYPLAIERRHLSVDEAVCQAEILRGRGFRHILLVAGDFPRLTSVEYYSQVVRALAERGVLPSVEIAPQATADYAALVEAGAVGVTLYQETYDPNLYRRYHPRGRKASYDWRLEGLDRAAEAGMRRLGLGILLGLADPRADLAALVRHGRYLQRRFPQYTTAFSLPRIHDAPPGFRIPYQVDDDTFVRMYCLLRIAFPEAELVLSTRERAAIRARLAEICITQLSAGSSTAPGGYAKDDTALRCGQQFPVCDARPPHEVVSWLESAGFRPVWEV